MAEAVVDDKGRILIPAHLRKQCGIREGTVISFERKGGDLILKPSRKKRGNMRELKGINPKRTGEPRWATPEEIKGIWG
ncbi:MAG: AbrB/MazE/SpoVT family DNA-binding domain-containing protein [Methanocellales archaeon]|nr:AbrB/MazE/SpoVT family DNA-binding domain-containing protein [Methanocellales archaeon]MDD3292153.1 AbrB/MazE/SpoVT family DNA-binding domain-containing protein [Methanocellales archaeon]MDD5235390.1 AbrB/MazE/SpoVT family DNA-binding domain-containing protein [Methanocellales archaeon]MDD5485662.1 AbrB/MazE/SpoVT family DNA-binding domain-containing protein [Methanocellales archaeon]